MLFIAELLIENPFLKLVSVDCTLIDPPTLQVLSFCALMRA